MLRLTSLLKQNGSRFAKCERGIVSADTVLVIALVSIPIVVFLIAYADDVREYIVEKSPVIFEEADSLIGG